jgi:hypothetical protein
MKKIMQAEIDCKAIDEIRALFSPDALAELFETIRCSVGNGNNLYWSFIDEATEKQYTITGRASNKEAKLTVKCSDGRKLDLNGYYSWEPYADPESGWREELFITNEFCCYLPDKSNIRHSSSRGESLTSITKPSLVEFKRFIPKKAHEELNGYLLPKSAWISTVGIVNREMGNHVIVVSQDRKHIVQESFPEYMLRSEDPIATVRLSDINKIDSLDEKKNEKIRVQLIEQAKRRVEEEINRRVKNRIGNVSGILSDFNKMYTAREKLVTYIKQSMFTEGEIKMIDNVLCGRNIRDGISAR